MPRSSRRAVRLIRAASIVALSAAGAAATFASDWFELTETAVAPALVWWTLTGPTGALAAWYTVADFHDGLPPPSEPYGWIYAPGTYQNKPQRPGNYVFWLAHDLDTTNLPDGTYTLVVTASDTRHNVGTASLPITLANGTG